MSEEVKLEHGEKEAQVTHSEEEERNETDAKCEEEEKAEDKDKKDFPSPTCVGPIKIKTPRIQKPPASCVVRKPSQEELFEKDHKQITELRRSVEGTIANLMDTTIITKSEEEPAKNSPQEEQIDVEQVLQQENEDSMIMKELFGDQQPDDIKNQQESEEMEDNFLITQTNKAVEGTVIPLLDLTIEIPAETPHVEVEETATTVLSYTDDEIVEAWHNFQETRTIPGIEMKDYVILYVKQLSDEAIEIEDYDLAQKLEDDIKAFTAAFSRAYEEAPSATPSLNLESRLEEVKQQKMMFEYEFEQKLNRVKERENRKLEQLEERQEEERCQFEARCQNPEFLQRFSKPSASLLQMWRIQKRLALAHDFEGAKEMKARADELQKKETEDAQRRAILSVQQNYEKLIEKQKRELECAKANGERKIKSLENQYIKEKEAREKLEKQVEVRMNEQKRAPQRKGSCLPSLNREIPTRAARTRSAFRKAEEAKPTIQLDVKLTNIRSVLGAGRNPKH